MMFHINGSRFNRYSPSNDQNTLIRDFSNEGCDLIRLGPWEGNLSIDDRRVALACQMGNDLKVIVFDPQQDSIVGERVFNGRWGDSNFDWISMSQSGDYVVISWQDSVRSYHANGNLDELAFLSDEGQHGDICVEEDGTEVYVQVICGGHSDRGQAGIMSYNLETGAKTALIPPDDFVCVGHLSCRNFRRPGWAYVSSGTHQEVFALQLDGSHNVQHFGHGHQTYNNPNDHFELLAAPSPDGCSVMFASDWDGSPAAYVASQR